LDQIKGESWFAECGDALIKHIPLYANVPDEKVNITFGILWCQIWKWWFFCFCLL